MDLIVFPTKNPLVFRPKTYIYPKYTPNSHHIYVVGVLCYHSQKILHRLLKREEKAITYFSHIFLFHFFFLLDKDTSCQRLFMQLLNLISVNKEFWKWKRFCLILFIHFPIQNYQIGTKKFGYLDMKWGNEKYAWFSTVYIHPF